MVIVEVRFEDLVNLHVEFIVVLHQERDVIKIEVVVFLADLTIILG